MNIITVHHNDVGVGLRKVLIRTSGTARVTPRSEVWASVSEGDIFHRFIGDARIYVAAIAPGAGEVWLQVQVDWHGPLPFTVTLFILEP